MVRVVIDAPQGVASLMVEQAGRWKAPITHLLNTHGHWDHFLDNAELLRQTGAKFGIHRDSAPLLATISHGGPLTLLKLSVPPFKSLASLARVWAIAA